MEEDKNWKAVSDNAGLIAVGDFVSTGNRVGKNGTTYYNLTLIVDGETVQFDASADMLLSIPKTIRYARMVVMFAERKFQSGSVIKELKGVKYVSGA